MRVCLVVFFLLVSSAAAAARAGVAYSDPAGGWDYIFQGDQLTVGQPGTGFTSLDKTWSHDNAEDQWDLSPIGGALSATNRPGGVSLLTDGGINFIRIQDTGDPRNYGGADLPFEDPGSNRKIFFIHPLTTNAAPNVLDTGFTLTFRARVPTNGTLDQLYWDVPSLTPAPYPAIGDGYLNSGSGKGNFMLQQSAGGAISFSLTVSNDVAQPGGPEAHLAGLTMNALNGNQRSAAVDFGQGTNNVLTLTPTQWHEFWAVIELDPASIGTHQIAIYADGATNAAVFRVTAGTGDDQEPDNFLGIGTPSTPQSGALDIDFIGFKLGKVYPNGAIIPNPPPAGKLELTNARLNGDQIQFSFDAAAGRSYRVEYKDSLSASSWTALRTIANAAGGFQTISDSTKTTAHRFYRVVAL